jgi:hypothetical protein
VTARNSPLPVNFRIAGNGAVVRQHFLWSLSFQQFRSHRFHNASRKLFGQSLQSSSLAFAFAFTPCRIRFARTIFVGIGHAILTYLASELSKRTLCTFVPSGLAPLMRAASDPLC